MLLGKNRKHGKCFDEIEVGENLILTEKIEDKDLLLYLGLTNDANPLYIQHSFAANTIFQKPIVPPIMLMGMITSSISKYLPGPGVYIERQELEFLHPVYHDETIHFILKVVSKNIEKNLVSIEVHAKNEVEKNILAGRFEVSPPAQTE